jgi:alpha-mannosidase
MKTKDTFYFIPHSHWEGAVFKTREQYLEMGLPNILRALKLLKQYPEYRYTLDQVCYVKPFLERYPEEEAAFRRFVKEGRLAIAGGTDVMLDVNMPGGESFVRQVLYGKRYFRRALGIDVTVGWQLDTFGHHAQMPQLLKLAGYRSFWFFRGVDNWKVPSEFFWEGLDGSRIPAFWLSHGYSCVAWVPDSLPKFDEFIRKQFESFTPFSRGPGRVGVGAGDVHPPEDHAPVMVRAFNRQAKVPFEVRFAVPTDFEKMVARRSNRPVITGELNPIFQGTYSSRIQLKQRTRELEGLLTTAEKLGVILRSLGARVDDGQLWRAWEPMLFNLAHDLMSGVMTDHVYDDTLRGFDFSRRIAEEEVQGRLRNLAGRIDTRGEGTALVVVNPLGWTRTDVVFARVGFSEAGVRSVKLFDAEGRPVPVQIVRGERRPDGTLFSADIAFVARDVPSLGHAVYRVAGSTAPAEESAIKGAGLENEFYRLEVDPCTGAITRLVRKQDHWNVLGGLGNVVAMEEDHGDFWELYRGLDGASRIAMKVRHPAPKAGRAKFSIQRKGKPGVVTHGPVFSEFSVVHPMSAKGRFRTTIRLFAGLRRIEIRTEILNNDKFVRYRVLFPTSIRKGRRTDEIPFGAIGRPDGIEFPAQNWIDYGDGRKGVALLNRGLPGNNVADGVMMLSLMRSENIGGYGYQGGYEPGMTSDTGFELGKELSFQYALLPHSGDWREAAVYRHGAEFNQPLIGLTASTHPGRLPARWRLLEISNPQVMVSTLKDGANGRAVLRIYEASGRTAQATRIRFSRPIAMAEEVSLMEESVRKLKVRKETLSLNLRPFEIKTLRLRFRR